MSKYDTLERLKGRLEIDVRDFIKNNRLSEDRDPHLDAVENLLIDMIHSQGIKGTDSNNYDFSFIISKKSNT